MDKYGTVLQLRGQLAAAFPKC